MPLFSEPNKALFGDFSLKKCNIFQNISYIQKKFFFSVENKKLRLAYKNQYVTHNTTRFKASRKKKTSPFKSVKWLIHWPYILTNTLTLNPGYCDSTITPCHWWCKTECHCASIDDLNSWEQELFITTPEENQKVPGRSINVKFGSWAAEIRRTITCLVNPELEINSFVM